MKGNISLTQFISDVKDEIVSALLKDPSQIFSIEDVQLEVNFGIQAEAGIGFKFFVFDAAAKTSASQSHKVTIKMTPLIKQFTEVSAHAARRGKNTGSISTSSTRRRAASTKNPTTKSPNQNKKQPKAR